MRPTKLPALFIFYQEENSVDKPAVALTMFGVTTPCIQQLTKKT